MQADVILARTPPGYLRFSRLSFLAGVAYERTMERWFPDLRGTMVVVEAGDRRSRHCDTVDHRRLRHHAGAVVEAATIAAAVDSVLSQQVDGSLELVVADGLSSDGTREYLDERAAVDSRLRVVANEAQTTPHGLNAALAVARGAYTVRMDKHSIAPPDFVKRLIAHLDEGRCEGAGGIVRAIGRSPFGRAVALAHGSKFGIGNAKHHYADTPQLVDHIAHGAYVTERLRSIGGFDTAFVRNQDYELDHRYRLAGGRLLLDPSVVFDWWVRR